LKIYNYYHYLKKAEYSSAIYSSIKSLVCTTYVQISHESDKRCS